MALYVKKSPLPSSASKRRRPLAGAAFEERVNRLRVALVETGEWRTEELNYESYKKSRGWREEGEELNQYRARILQLASSWSLRLVARVFGLTRQALQHWRRKQALAEQLVLSILSD